MSELHVTVETAGPRLDRFLSSQLPQHSRAFLQKLIAAGNVTVNRRAGKPSYRVRPGDTICVEVPPPRPLATQPEEIPLDLLFEDADLIVINKPAGIVVHPAAGNYSGTLVNALLHHCRGKLAGIGGVERPGIVHRLDKGTTGCLVIAKTDFAHQSLVSQFKSHLIVKIYRAVCRGVFDTHEGKIETMIGRSTQDRKKMSAKVTKGKIAHTEYKVLRQCKECAIVELRIRTGRTHQIRVHMAHIGHPIIGDGTYGRMPAKEISVARPLLHAYKLGLVHPRTGARMEFTAPMPADMRFYERS